MIKFARWLARRLDPTYPYRSEAWILHDPQSADDPTNWLRVPIAAAFFSIGWQLLVVALPIGLSYVVVPGALFEGNRGVALAVFLYGGALFLGLGIVSSLSLYVRAVRRREWVMLLSGFAGVDILRGLDYAVGRRGPIPPVDGGRIKRD